MELEAIEENALPILFCDFGHFFATSVLNVYTVFKGFWFDCVITKDTVNKGVLLQGAPKTI